MNKLVKTVNSDNLNYEFLKSLNGILKLTDRELELLTKLIEIDSKFDPTLGYSKNVASTENRKMIKKVLGITPDNLSRYLTKFKQEGLIVKGKSDDELVVNKILMPEIIKDRVQLTIILKINDNEQIKNS